MVKLVGPFREVLTLRGVSAHGAISDDKLEIVRNAGILIEDGMVKEVSSFLSFEGNYEHHAIDSPMVVIPGLIDSHTHMCWGGTRAQDYARRIAGMHYQEILARGGGIHDTVNKTRASSKEQLVEALRNRLLRHQREGVTTVEIKSGYGLSEEHEIKMLEVIKGVGRELPVDVISTCLAAHVRPGEFDSNSQYLDYVIGDVLPGVIKDSLSKRVDIFVEENAFSVEEAHAFLLEAKKMSFDLTVHADQFSSGGSKLAVEIGALSADHLEASNDDDIKRLANSAVVSTVLPGASLGLGLPFAPARKLLDSGAQLAIASDWNPGSAPMGDLLVQAALIGAAEKLSTAETLAGVTFRAAHALGLRDRGQLIEGKRADFIAFPTSDYREILWNQGKMKPECVWIKGEVVL